MIPAINSKMKSKLVMLLFVTLVSSNVVSMTEIPDFYSMDWTEQLTKVQLPEPFNEVTIKINKSGERLEGIVLTVGGKEIRFSDDFINDIENISEPSFSYGRIDFDKDKKIDSFDISFEYGYPKLVNLGDVPGCESPCMEPIRDIVVFTVDRNRHVSREFESLGSVN